VVFVSQFFSNIFGTWTRLIFTAVVFRRRSRSPALSRALSISRSQTEGPGYCTLARCDDDHQKGFEPCRLRGFCITFTCSDRTGSLGKSRGSH